MRELIERLEQANEGNQSNNSFDELRELSKRKVKKVDENERSMTLRFSNITVDVQESSNDPAMFLSFKLNGKTFFEAKDVLESLEEVNKLVGKIL